jgi:transcriptional regulator with XRE-family HTH domain
MAVQQGDSYMKERERRFAVWQLRQKGLSQTAIAEQLQVSQSTVSTICQFLDDSEVLRQMIEAEEQPIELSGNPNIDAMEREARSLERTKARVKPDSKLYLQQSEHIGWLRLKAEELRQTQPNQGAKTHYEFRASSPILQTPSIKLNMTIDPELREDFVSAGRVFELACPTCAAPVWAQLDYSADRNHAPGTIGVDFDEEADDDKDEGNVASA